MSERRDLETKLYTLIRQWRTSANALEVKAPQYAEAVVDMANELQELLEAWALSRELVDSIVTAFKGDER